MKRMVLDASALISYFENRPGGNVVEEVLSGCIDGKTELIMSIVNWGEVYYSLGERAVRMERGASRLKFPNSPFSL